MSVDNPETGGVKYSAEIRTQAYAMQNMSHQELCQEIIEIDNKAHMVGFKNGKFAMKSHPTQTEPVDNPELETPDQIGNILDDLMNIEMPARYHNTDWAAYAIDAYYKALSTKQGE